MKINVLLVWYLREDLSHPLFQSIQSFFVEKAGRRQEEAKARGQEWRGAEGRGPQRKRGED